MSSSNFDYMWSKLPSIMKKDNIKEVYLALSKAFDALDYAMEIHQNIHLIDFAEGLDLEKIGRMLGIHREEAPDIVYRSRIKVYYYTYYFVPNLNNILFLIKNIMGYYPDTLTEGWARSDSKESGTLLLKVTIPVGINDSLLLDFDAIYSAGGRIDWKKLQEAYSVTHCTGLDFTSEILRPYEQIERVVLGDTLGTKLRDSTSKIKTTGDISPYDAIPE